MDCKEYYELVSSAVDNRLQQEEMATFLEHGRQCPPCRCEYESELVTKMVVKGKARMVRTPDALMKRIALELGNEQGASFPVTTRWWQQLFNRPYVKPALAFGVACIAVILLLKSPNVTSPKSSDFIIQSLDNYNSVVKGDIKPQLASSVPENLLDFFTGKTDFPVILPKMKDCRLVGGVSNEYSGMMLAHVMYKLDADMICMSQTCWEKVVKGEKISLPQEVKDELQRTGWFTKSYSDGSTVVLWTKGRTLCAAVARMSKEDLIACLTEVENPGDRDW